MIKEKTEEKEITKIEKIIVAKECYCDICRKLIYTKTTDEKNFLKIKSDVHILPYYFNVSTHHRDWGNDSCDSYESFDICSHQCLNEQLEEYLDQCKSSMTQVLEIEQMYI